MTLKINRKLLYNDISGFGGVGVLGRLGFWGEVVGLQDSRV